MIPLPLDELRGLGELHGGADAVTGVEIDSRRVGGGELFVAIRGGRAFVDDARARGAAATLVPADDFAAMAAIGRAVRARITSDSGTPWPICTSGRAISRGPGSCSAVCCATTPSCRTPPSG